MSALHHIPTALSALRDVLIIAALVMFMVHEWRR
jgi:hypothetical protein